MVLVGKRRTDPTTHKKGQWLCLKTLGLTMREVEVFKWVARGKCNAGVAAILGISRRTVQKHLERIFIKLGVNNRTAAVAAFYELKLGKRM